MSRFNLKQTVTLLAAITQIGGTLATVHASTAFGPDTSAERPLHSYQVGLSQLQDLLKRPLADGKTLEDLKGADKETLHNASAELHHRLTDAQTQLNIAGNTQSVPVHTRFVSLLLCEFGDPDIEEPEFHVVLGGKTDYKCTDVGSGQYYIVRNYRVGPGAYFGAMGGFIGVIVSPIPFNPTDLKGHWFGVSAVAPAVPIILGARAAVAIGTRGSIFFYIGGDMLSLGAYAGLSYFRITTSEEIRARESKREARAQAREKKRQDRLNRIRSETRDRANPTNPNSGVWSTP